MEPKARPQCHTNTPSSFVMVGGFLALAARLVRLFSGLHLVVVRGLACFNETVSYVGRIYYSW
jgi:hypothetical protein